MSDTNLGFLDPDKIEEFSLPEHLKMVKAGTLKKSELPVFGIKRITGDDRLLLSDKESVSEVMADTGNTVVTSKRNEVTVDTIRKYWVSATNLKVGSKDLSFTAGQIGHDINIPIKVMPLNFLLYMYLKILNGSDWEEEEVKNSESRDTAPSDTTS